MLADIPGPTVRRLPRGGGLREEGLAGPAAGRDGPHPRLSAHLHQKMMKLNVSLSLPPTVPELYFLTFQMKNI